MKFLVDRMLGSLATWLRILGFDAAYYPHPYSRRLHYTSLQEQRIIVTRNRRVSSRRCYGLVYIESEKLPQQLLQIIVPRKVSKIK